MTFLTQPPDPHPKVPQIKCPPGAIDCHVHLFGPAADFPFQQGSKYVSEDALAETNIALQDILGLSGAVIVSGGAYGTDYRHLVHVLQTHPQRFKGVALLQEQVTIDEIAMLDKLGVRGVRFVSPGHHAGALPKVSPRVASMVAEFGWHVLFYPMQDLEQWSAQLLDLPNPIVLDHFACIRAAEGIDQPAFRLLLELLSTGRVWVKISGPMRCSDLEFPYADMLPFARALLAHAPDRMLWGSDWPHVSMNDRSMPNDGDLFDLLGDQVEDAALRQRILVDNPRVLYGKFGA